MLKNKLLIFFSIFFIILITILTYITVNPEPRRFIYSKLIGGYKLYNYHVVGGHAYNRDFKSASKKIIDYIEFSQRFAEGKNIFIQGILDTTSLITAKAYTQEDFNLMQNVYVRIDEITDDIYINHIWLARSLSDDNLEESIKHLNKAINLSKASEEAYREIIRLFSQNKELGFLLKKYCKIYFNEFGGSTQGRIATAQDDNKIFYGTNSIFAISKNDDNSKLYSKLINELNNYQKYNFFFEKLEDINQFNIFKNFFSGTKISIKNIIIHNDKKNNINLNDTTIHSVSSYVIKDTNEEVVFLNGDNPSDIIKFNFDRIYNDVNQISLEMKLEKLYLTNNSVCEKFYEN